MTIIDGLLWPDFKVVLNGCLKAPAVFAYTDGGGNVYVAARVADVLFSCGIAAGADVTDFHSQSWYDAANTASNLNGAKLYAAVFG